MRSRTVGGGENPHIEQLPLDSLPQLEPSPGFGLLADIRVLDLTTSLAGPYSTLLLADLGADVVKIERPGVGDDSRMWGPPFLDGNSLWFLAVNRNKRSVAIDYSTRAARDLLARLIGAADVIVTNLRAGALVRAGLDYATVRSVRPDIIHCTITGFGLSGPRSSLPCYDLIAEGYSGVMDLTGEPENLPQKIGTAAADLLAGMDAAYAIVAALFDRIRNKRGHQLDISLTDSMTRFVTPRLVSYLGTSELPRRSGGRDSVIAIYQVFATRDEPLTVAIGNDSIFQRFCVAIGREDLRTDPRYATNQGRRDHRAELVEAIAEVMATRRRFEWLEAFAENDVPGGPINRLDEVCQDLHGKARRLFYAIPAGRGIPQVNTAWHLDGAPNGYRLSPPDLGANTEEVLREWCGLDNADIDLERAKGVLGPPQDIGRSITKVRPSGSR